MVCWAAIDVGTNSTRLLIAEIGGDKIQPLERDLLTTRLGEGTAKTGLLQAKARERTLAAVTTFLDRCRKAGVDQVRLGATSAVREAKNREEFRQEIEAATGYQLEVFSGTMEARLSFLGVTGSLPLAQEGPTLVIDIGGGSTELIWGVGKDLVEAISLPLGAVRLTEAFVSNPEQPVPGDQLEKLAEHVAAGLKQAPGPSFEERLLAVGVGGTVTTLAAIHFELEEYSPQIVHGAILPLNVLSHIQTKLSGMELEGRKRVRGLQPERADIIIAGTVILTSLLKRLELPEIVASEGDILLGMLADLI